MATRVKHFSLTPCRCLNTTFDALKLNALWFVRDVQNTDSGFMSTLNYDKVAHSVSRG